MSGLDPQALRRAFGSFMTGVTVVTTLDRTGAPVGFTANSFTSVSLTPPMLLVCPGRFLSSFAAFQSCPRFAVSVLAEEQEHVSNIFASFKGDRFAEVAWTPDGHGVPLIDGALATFSCRTAQAIETGDHIVLLGEITRATQSDGRGLGYAGGKYVKLGLERAAATGPMPGTKAIAGAIVEWDGQVLLEDSPAGLRPPQVMLDNRQKVRAAVHGHFARAGVQMTLGPAFSIFDDRASGLQHIYFQGRAHGPDDGGLGRFHPIGGLSGKRFVSHAHATMLSRYAAEYRTQSFGLYLGDETAGDVQSPNQGG